MNPDLWKFNQILNKYEWKEFLQRWIYLSKLHVRAERFDDMVKSIINFVKLVPVLSKEKKFYQLAWKNKLIEKIHFPSPFCKEKKEEYKNPENLYYL